MELIESEAPKSELDCSFNALGHVIELAQCQQT